MTSLPSMLISLAQFFSLILPPSPCFTDWDHSEFGKHVATLKTSYPHMESDWNDGQSAWEPWVDDFANAAVVYILRSPRNAIVNYYSMKQELALAQNWDSAHSRVSATYTYIRLELLDGSSGATTISQTFTRWRIVTER